MASAAGPVQVEVTVADGVRRTTTRTGESWFDAARRAVGADVVAGPVPADLSGAVKRFAVSADPPVVTRPMTRGDLPLLVPWRAAEHVLRWWDPLPSADAELEARYGPRIDGTDPTSMWVWELEGRPVGMVQDYRREEDLDAVAGDYLIGAPELVGRGLGTRCLWSWVRHVRRRHPGCPRVFAAPDHRNTASLRALAKVGFVAGDRFEETQDDGTVETLVGCTLDLPVVVGDGRPQHDEA